MFKSISYLQNTPKFRTDSTPYYRNALMDKLAGKPPFDHGLYRFAQIYNAASYDFFKRLHSGQLIYHPHEKEFGTVKGMSLVGEHLAIHATFPGGMRRLVVNAPGTAQIPSWNHAEPEEIALASLRADLDRMILCEMMPFDDLPEIISAGLLQKHNLNGIRQRFGSIYEMVDAAYPRQFHAWQFSHNGQRIWTREDNSPNYELARQATRWLVEKKLNLKPEDAANVPASDFNKNGLSGMLSKAYGSSPRKAIEDTYPEIEFSYRIRSPNHWQRSEGLKEAIAALKKLVEDENIPESEIPKRLRYSLLEKHKLTGIVAAVPSKSHIDLALKAYPQFTRQDFKDAIKEANPKMYWATPAGLEDAICKIKSLVKKKGIPEKEIPWKVTQRMIREERISSVVLAVPSHSLTELIALSYPQLKPEDFPKWSKYRPIG